MFSRFKLNLFSCASIKLRTFSQLSEFNLVELTNCNSSHCSITCSLPTNPKPFCSSQKGSNYSPNSLPQAPSSLLGGKITAPVFSLFILWCTATVLDSSICPCWDSLSTFLYLALCPGGWPKWTIWIGSLASGFSQWGNLERGREVRSKYFFPGSIPVELCQTDWVPI